MEVKTEIVDRKKKNMVITQRGNHRHIFVVVVDCGCVVGGCGVCAGDAADGNGGGGIHRASWLHLVSITDWVLLYVMMEVKVATETPCLFNHED